MIASLLLHVHELPAGRVVVTPIDFPRYSVDADSYEAARRVAIARVESTLKNHSVGSLRSSLAGPESAELDSVVLDLPSKLVGSEPLQITVSLVVTLRSTSHGELYVVKAPEIPDVEVAVTKREEASAAIKKALEEDISGWELQYLLACDLVGEVRLESADVHLPGASMDQSGYDDDFDVQAVSEDLIRLAREDLAGHLDERDELLAEVTHALTSTGSNSVILVGPPNVGKSALVHQLARSAIGEDESNPLHGRSMMEISANQLVAGAKYTGMWQDRARALVDLGRTSGVIFAMGDPLGMIDVGKWAQSDNNLSRALRPAIESGTLTLVCECTPEAYAAAKQLEPSFIQAFRRIDIAEPDARAIGRIAETEARRISERESVEIDPDAVTTAIDLTTKFQPYMAQPGKAIRLVNEAAKRLARLESSDVLDRATMIEEFATETGLPKLVLSDDVRLDRDAARGFFEERVLGQDEAVDAMVDLISVVKAGLNNTEKPLGAFFCVGPTGVGKTELTKALAEYLFGSRERMIRLDMGEYTSEDSVVKLVGTKWGRGDEGELTRRVREQPFCVVLLDEIEKANRGVFDVLLSVLGEGRLTDAAGRTADFRNAIIVLTSNLGADKVSTPKIGFSETDAKSEADRMREHFIDRAQKFFKPEFYNRIDRVIAFRPLDRETIRKIARRELGKLLDRQGIVSRQLLVEIDDAVVESMAKAGFDPKFGARPLQRQIERSVIQPLARLIVEKHPGPGDLIRFTMEGDGVSVELRKVTMSPEVRGHVRSPEAEAEDALSSATRRIELLEQQIEHDELESMADRLRAERSELVNQTNQPSFWDDPESAKETLARMYQLDRALERLDRMLARVGGLSEMAVQVDQKRDRSGKGEVRQAVAEIEDEMAVVRLELAGAVLGSDQGAAKVRVVPIGGAVEWADSLLQMYVSWAAQSGRESELVSDREARIAGLSSYDLLKSEAGLHRQVVKDKEFLARVHVVTEEATSDSADGDASDEVVRVYSEGKNQFVRDQRTGVRIGDVASVFRGRIDDFLVSEATRQP